MYFNQNIDRDGLEEGKSLRQLFASSYMHVGTIEQTSR